MFIEHSEVFPVGAQSIQAYALPNEVQGVAAGGTGKCSGGGAPLLCYGSCARRCGLAAAPRGGPGREAAAARGRGAPDSRGCETCHPGRLLGCGRCCRCCQPYVRRQLQPQPRAQPGARAQSRRGAAACREWGCAALMSLLPAFCITASLRVTASCTTNQAQLHKVRAVDTASRSAHCSLHRADGHAYTELT